MDDRIDSAEDGTYSVGAAQAEILKMLEPDEGTSDDSEEAVDESEVDLEAEGEASGDEDFEEELLEAESDQFEDDAELDDDEEDSQSESNADEVFTVKVDGEEIEVSGLDELKAGYSRQADYTKKSQALAEERNHFTQDRDAVVLERQQYAQLLGALQTQIQVGDDGQQPDFDQLYDADPIEAARQERQWNKRQNERANKLAAIQGEQARVADANLKENEQQMQTVLNQEVVRLPDLIPSWKDPKIAERESAELRKYLEESGISEEEMGSLVRASHISVLRKAMLFDRGKKQVRKAKAKRKNTVQPGSRSSQSKPSTKRAKAQRQRLAKTGKLHDATALIESLL